MNQNNLNNNNIKSTETTTNQLSVYDPLNTNGTNISTDDFTLFSNFYPHFQSNKNLNYLAQDLLNSTNEEFDLLGVMSTSVSGISSESSSSLIQTPNYANDIVQSSTSFIVTPSNQSSEPHQQVAHTLPKEEPNEKKINNKKSTTRKRKKDSKEESAQTDEKKEKKKSKPANQRRNIKKIITDDKLNESTLRALNEEKERIERLTKSNEILTNLLTGNTTASTASALNSVNSKNDDFNSSLNASKTSDKSSDQSVCLIEDETPSATCKSSNMVTQMKTTSNASTFMSSRLEQKAAYFSNYNATFYQNLLASSQLNSSMSRPPPPPPPQPTNLKEIVDLEAESINDDDDDIIECDETKPEDDDDDCRILSEAEHLQEEQALKRRIVRGIHMNDELNVPNENGQVLVNVNHCAEDCDIFLLPYLAKNVKPHQIGGIRFMYDNIVESLARIKEKQTGFGCILAHAMGLGKTLQVISFIEVFLRCTQAKRVLCIVPINTIQNWQAEFNNWLPENGQQKLDNDTIINYKRPFKVNLINDYARSTKQRIDVILDWNDNGGVLLIGYEMFRTLIANSKVPPKQTAQTKKNKTNSSAEQTEVDDEEEMLQKQNIIREALLTPCLVVCDEGHRIKNNAANIAKTLQTIRTKRRIVLTGYPLQNNLIEYWCMVDFVRPSYLGTKAEFSNMFERPIMNGQCMDSTREDVKLMRFRAHVLHSLLEGFVQRRGHDVFLNTLPKKQEFIILLKLSSIQKELYLAFMEAIGAMSSSEKTNPLRSFAICCKIWNHPDVLYKYFVDKESEIDLDLPELQQTQQQATKKSKASTLNSTYQTTTSSSVLVQEDGFNPFGASALSDSRTNKYYYDPDWASRLMETYKSNILENGAKFLITFSLIEESIKCGDKILLFSQSLLSLDLIEEYLQQFYVTNTNEKWKKYKNYYRLDGSTPGVERERLVNAFNKPNNELWLFLLSTRAGCLGINLIGANRVIVLDASWNPCHDAQAVCRVYRYGQRKNCFIYRLIADHTMEKKIYDRQISKQSMSDRVIDEIQGENHFTRTEVEKLIHFVKEDVPSADLSQMNEKFDDTVLINSCTKHAHVITKEPFTHESLLIDKKEYQLSEREKALAFREYQHDKKYFPYMRNTSITSTAASLFYQKYGSNSFASFTSINKNNNNYSLNSSTSSSASLCSTSLYSNQTSNTNNYSQMGSNLYNNIIKNDNNDNNNNNNNNKYLDFNININQSLPNTSFLNSNNIKSSSTINDKINTSNTPTLMKYLNSSDHIKLNNYEQVQPTSSQQQQQQQQQQPQQTPNLKDVKISRFTASSQLIIPTIVSSNDATDQQNSILIQPGQTVFLLQTPKGCYLRTADKKYIALRGQTFEDLFTNGLDRLSANYKNNQNCTTLTNNLGFQENSNINACSSTGLFNSVDQSLMQQQPQQQQSLNFSQQQNYNANNIYSTNNFQQTPSAAQQSYDLFSNTLNSNLDQLNRNSNQITNSLSPGFNLNENNNVLLNSVGLNSNYNNANNTNNSMDQFSNINTF